MSYIPCVKTKSDYDWVPNGMRFETIYEAEQYLEDLKDRWFAVTHTRVQKSDDPANYVLRGGRCWPIHPNPEEE